MSEDDTLNLQRLAEMGLNRYEALAYLALLGHDDSTAVEVADRAGIPRQRVYDILESLRLRGVIHAREGRPVRHMARPPSAALAELLAARKRQQAAENARLERLVQELVPYLEQTRNGNGAAAPREAERRVDGTVGGGL